MPTEINNRKTFRLSEVANSIKKTLSDRYTSSFWVTGEIHKLNYYSSSGHAYPELVEKEDNKILVEMRGVIWKSNLSQINRNFNQVLQTTLQDGIKVLMLVMIEYTPMYGVQLKIIDIDPTFTLGDLEKEKRETLLRLKKENLYDLNRKTTLPLLPQRIAVISADNSKGYLDFMKILEGNPFGYKYFTMLFPALLQGDRSTQSIITQLERIKKVKHHFDAVALLRGGGGEVGLSSYNKYELSKAIAEFPLPVITGVGHSTNETVAELVSYYNAITPTKTAEFLIQKFHDFAVPLEEHNKTILRESREQLSRAKEYLMQLRRLLKTLGESGVEREKRALANLSSQLSSAAHSSLKDQLQLLQRSREQMHSLSKLLSERNFSLLKELQAKITNSLERLNESETLHLNALQKQVRLLDPKNTLKRGYSITQLNGKAITGAQDLRENDEIETLLFEGSIKSKVTQRKTK